MATLPSTASLTGASTTNAQQKTNFTDLRAFLSDLLGTDSGNKAAARAALGVDAADPGSSLTASGYQKLPSGLIIQWGSLGGAPGGGNTIGFPVAFPSIVLSASANIQAANFNTYSCNISGVTTTQMDVRVTIGNVGTQAGFYWFAIGI